MIKGMSEVCHHFCKSFMTTNDLGSIEKYRLYHKYQSIIWNQNQGLLFVSKIETVPHLGPIPFSNSNEYSCGAGGSNDSMEPLDFRERCNGTIRFLRFDAMELANF